MKVPSINLSTTVNKLTFLQTPKISIKQPTDLLIRIVKRLSLIVFFKLEGVVASTDFDGMSFYFHGTPMPVKKICNAKLISDEK